MTRSTLSQFTAVSRSRRGFSLIEVVLAIGIFLVTVLALVGLLGPTLQSVDEVEKTDEIASVVSTVNAFLQSSPNIAPNASKFDAIYGAVASGDSATLFVFRQYFDSATGNTNANATDVRLQVGFKQDESTIDASAQITDFSNAAGPIYRDVLTPSSVLPSPTAQPAKYRSVDRVASTNTYTLNADLDDYEEGYFAMEVRIFAEDPPPPGGTFVEDVALTALVDIEPLFTYNTAVVR